MELCISVLLLIPLITLMQSILIIPPAKNINVWLDIRKNIALIQLLEDLVINVILDNRNIVEIANM